MQRNGPEPRDDVDRLFARMQSVAPPADLKQRILRSLPTTLPASPAQARPTPRPHLSARQWQWGTAIAGVLLLIMSVRLGTLMDDSGALSVLGQMGSNFGDFLSAPGDYLVPLAAELPWLDLIIALAALVAFWVGSSASVDRARGKR
jgi:hypothetical protein